ncbi:MAG: O-antigen ligase family protein [Acidobacteriota bacterium]
MSYALTLAYVALLYVRPGELVREWAGIPFVAATGLLAAITSVWSLFLRPRAFADLPNDWCFFGFVGAATLSIPANGWIGGSYYTLLALLPLLLLYLLIRLAVRTPQQLRGLIILLVALTLFQGVNGVVQYWTGVGFGDSTAYAERYEQTDEDLLGQTEVTVERRVRGTGIFGDPNDLAMSLVMVFPFLFTAILTREPGNMRRVAALAALGLLAYALLLTQSRGGLVGLAALGAAYLYRRSGRVAPVVAVVVIAGFLLAAGSGRLREMRSSEASAQGRIQAWSAGLQMLKAKPVLGVGYDAYTEHHELVAHNSFVHTFAELGLVGGYFFIGMFFWLYVGNGAGRNVADAASSAFARDIWASAVGMTVCALFLSRQYSPVLYVILAMGAARISVERKSERLEPIQKRSDWGALAGLTAAAVVAAYVAVRLLAVWSRA